LKVLVIGSGGREHVIAWKLSQSPRVAKVVCAPGNAGTGLLGQNVEISATDIDGLLQYVLENGIDLTVVGPEAPLVAGIVDRFKEQGLKVVGPTAAAARLEGSKVFAKDFFNQHGIPTGESKTFDDAEAAETWLRTSNRPFPVVVKADGLAAGKGVLICQNLTESLAAVDKIMRQRAFGEAGSQVIVEEFLRGEEASFMVFTDGSAIVPMVPSQDHKAIYEGDRGPNTGGMGAYSADFLLSEELREQILSQIIDPTIAGMADLGTPFQGILYAGLMLTEEGPKVLEYNVRLGDPEAQAVLPRLKSDLFEILLAMADERLAGCQVEWLPDPSVCVVVASQGYPGAYEKGHEITGISMAEEDSLTTVFHAGTRLEDHRVLTSGGRVLGVTSLASSLESAIMRVYEAVNKVHFKDMYYRRDIASKGLRKLGIRKG
jgi:phosphoribosylamine--glycine ligase